MPDTLLWRAFVGSKLVASVSGHHHMDADAFVAYLRNQPNSPYRLVSIRVEQLVGRQRIETRHAPLKAAA